MIQNKISKLKSKKTWHITSLKQIVDLFVNSIAIQLMTMQILKMGIVQLSHLFHNSSLLLTYPSQIKMWLLQFEKNSNVILYHQLGSMKLLVFFCRWCI